MWVVIQSTEKTNVQNLYNRGRGRPRATFVDNLSIDSGVETTDKLDTFMLVRIVWRRVILDPRAAPADLP